jgi:outer membrane protein assembly factor BamB
MVGDSVLTHHKNPSRDGLYVQPTFTKAAIGTLHRDTAFSGTLPMVGGQAQQIYAQPLFVDGMGGQDLVVVATEQNNVYALDGATGAAVWAKSLGAPVPSVPPLPCGNIFPMGVTGTPVIDYASRTLFVDAMVLLGSSTYHHQIFALSLDTGAVQTGWPVDVDATAKSGTTSFDSTAQGQRGALALVGGTVYVPYGGLFGDCGTYHGWVVAVPIASPASVSAWVTTYDAGGSWMPGGVSSDGASLFVSTGNTFDPTSPNPPPWGGGDAMIRLTPSPLAMSAYFAPANWIQLDDEDLDIGTAPIPFDLAGATPSALAILFGKDGNAYLVDRSNPGGVGAALGANAAACTATDTTNACASLHVATDEIISAPVLYTTATATYVATRGNGAQCANGSGDLLTVKVSPGSPPTLKMGWCATNGTGSPMVTTSDGHADAIVWDLGAESDNRLHAFDGDTGAAIPFTDSAVAFPGMVRYNTPIAAKGRIFVPVAGGVVALSL